MALGVNPQQSLPLNGKDIGSQYIGQMLQYFLVSVGRLFHIWARSDADPERGSEEPRGREGIYFWGRIEGVFAKNA